ncbi:hypothetical protein [Cellulomonas sp. PhB150]|uniref:hypothetical protein n=1 Tax=Cellulomonas sp. PhB150 TaxID=2485188 RepID=UPI000F476908|nr:hypothetical protein [Cellulomonas sp. PhB150]ROS23937.1 hypothetical protein EDF34_3000 [Cellulomonas sp. PhB150]
MSAPGEFLEFSDTSDDAVDRLLAAAGQDWRAMGRARAVFRSWPGNVFWIIVGVLVLALVVLIATRPDDAGRIVAAAIAGGFLFFVALIAGSGVLERHRVCEHGLVVGFRTKSSYTIPWSTVDPGRVRVVRRSNLLGRLPGRTASSPHIRHGAASGTALALNGLDTALGTWIPIPGLGGVTDAVRPGSRFRSTPFVWWFLGGRHPEKLVRAIEDAMVADGYPAVGLADRAISQGVTLRYNPGAWEPFPARAGVSTVVGVDGQPQP